jgi:hypothetical protein
LWHLEGFKKEGSCDTAECYHCVGLQGKDTGQSESCDAKVCAYGDYEWNDLPGNVKKAAIELGFDEDIWLEGLSPDGANCYWDDLSDQKQKAAAILGYNRKGWNEETDAGLPADDWRLPIVPSNRYVHLQDDVLIHSPCP